MRTKLVFDFNDQAASGTEKQVSTLTYAAQSVVLQIQRQLSIINLRFFLFGVLLWLPLQIIGTCCSFVFLNQRVDNFS